MIAHTLLRRLPTLRMLPPLRAVGSWLTGPVGLPTVFGRTIAAQAGPDDPDDRSIEATDFLDLSAEPAGFFDHSNPMHQEMIVMRGVISEAIGGPQKLTVEYLPGHGWDLSKFGEPGDEFDPVVFKLNSETEDVAFNSTLPREVVRELVDQTLVMAISQRNRPVQIGSVPEDRMVLVLVGREKFDPADVVDDDPFGI